jgi:hypothetical protein
VGLDFFKDVLHLLRVFDQCLNGGRKQSFEALELGLVSSPAVEGPARYSGSNDMQQA